MVERLKIPTEIDQQLTGWEELLGRLREALEATAFSNRFVLPPHRLPQIAKAEADAFLDFLKTGDADRIREQGAKRAEEGLGEQAMLRLGTTLRQFCRDYLADEALRSADVYADALLEGFMEGREALVLREQEQIRKALQRVVNRYALQLATAAEVSHAASSILDPAKLLPEVVNLIRDRFNFYYVGLFLIDESGEYAVLRAGTGEAGRQMLEMGHKLEVGGTSMVGWCVANAKARIALDVGKEAVRFDNPLLPETRSEMALPLISRGRVIGAMTIQSAQSAAFSEEDIAVLQTMADQLANAIENARLYDGAQREITERRRAEETLAEERNLLRTIIDNLPDFIYAKDTESRFVVGNIGVARLMGATKPDELLGKTDFDFYPQELATQYHADEQEIIRSGQPLINWEEPLMDQVTGKRGWLSTTKVPLRDSLGKLVGIVGIGRDITERKRTEAALERRALQLQTSAEVSRAASSILDPDKLIQQVVDLVRERFDLYYAGLFLLDEERQFAVLRAGTGEAGRQMLEAGHKLEVGGESMIGRCVARGEARIALDVGEEAVRFDNPLLPETRSEMALPLVSRGQIMGAMTIQSIQSAAFSEEDIAVLQTMADQLANAIENARLFEEALARTQEVAALAETGRKLISTLELDAVLDSIMEACLELFQVQQAAFIMMDEDGYLRMRRHRGLSEEFVRSIVGRPGEGFYGKVYQSGEAILVRDAREQRDPATAEAVLREGITSFIHVPVKVKGETVAVMNLTSSQEDRRFSERDLERLSAFTDQAAVAIENARLFKEAQERAEELAALNTIASAVSRSLELQDLLQETLPEVISAMGFEAGLVSLADEMTGQLVLSAQSGLPGPLVSRFEEAGLGGTLCDCVFQTSEGLGISDLRDGAPVNVSGLLSHGIRSYLGAPLMYTGQSLGTLCIFSYSPQPLTAADFSLIAAIGQQLGVAVRNARLFEETQHRAVQLRVVNEVGRILTSILDVDTLLGQVVRLIRDTFDYYQVNLGLIEGDVLVPKASTGALSTLPAEIARLNLDAEAIVTKVVTSGTPLLVPDVCREPLYLPLPGLEEVQSELAVPLKSKDQVIGVLDVESDRLDAFDEGDLTVLEALAGQIAVAIENARLFQETKANLEEITLLHRRYLQEAWSEFLEEETGRERAGYMYDRGIVSPASTVWRPEIGLAMQRGDTIALSDMADALQGTVEEIGAILQASPTQSALAVPLKVRGQVIGALDFYENDQMRDWSAEDIAMVEAVANQIALAIENARAYEELQKTAEQLKEMDRLKTQFLANMSHELRTPLNSIIGFSRVILKGIDGPITEQQRADLTSIYNNGQHLLGMINDILDISKIEAGKMELIFEPVDVQQIISGVMSTAIALVGDKPIELKQEVAPNLPIIRADGTRVRQVILNLLSNAAKFTEEGQITLRAWADEEQITIGVEDTGIGIPPEHQTTIFEEFRQVDASTTRRTGGTGLGLAISRHFVEMQGGCIWVESEPGVGSTFTFTLPITGPAPVAKSELAALTIDPSRKLILAVEDDEGAIAIYKRYLEKQGYQVVGLNQGEQAVRWALELSPYAIILDVLLPDTDGWTVLEELKSSRETHQIPVIICTIIDDEEARGLSLGAADYLIKPILEEDLLQSLQRLEERQRI